MSSELLLFLTVGALCAALCILTGSRVLRLLRKFLGRFPAKDAGLPAAPVAPDWTQADMGAWQRFLGSDVGQRLWARFRAVEFRNYQTGCNDSMFSAHSAGRAKGFSDARDWLESLSRTACVTADSPSGELPETHDMPGPDGEAQLHERYSP